MTEIADIKTLLQPIAASIKPLGFKKIGNRKWYRLNEETEQLILLSRYRFEPKHHLYLLGNILRFRRAQAMDNSEFSMSSFTESLMPDRSRIKKALDQESDLPPIERERIFHTLFSEYVNPLIEGTTTEQGAISCYMEFKNIDKFGIFGDTMRALHLTPQERGW